MTLVVNLYGGPGTGKSTTAAGAFAQLKSEGVKAELVHEFAKDLTWEERHAALRYQPYIFGKQSWHIERLMGKTDVIITDSPILLSSHIYNDRLWTAQKVALEELGRVTHAAWTTLDIFLERNPALHPFVQAGRNQDEVQSTNLDYRIRKALHDLGIVHYSIQVGPRSTGDVVELVHTAFREEHW